MLASTFSRPRWAMPITASSRCAPAAYQGAAEETMARLAISKQVTLTSTYDHRIIQGAQSGDFLRHIHGLLLGDGGFWDEVFQAWPANAASP